MINKNFVKENKSEFMLMGTLFVLIVAGICVSDRFLCVMNIRQILIQFVELGILTCGMAACIISGGFDLSIGAIVGLNSIVIALMLSKGYGIVITVICVFAISVCCGMINGVLIGYIKIPAMVATLGTTALFSGVGLVISKGHAISGIPDRYLVFSVWQILGLPIQVIILMFCVLAFWIIFEKTKIGRGVYLVGSNYTVAHYSGIFCERTVCLVYVFSSLMAFCMSFIITLRLATGRVDFADNYVMQSVAAAVFGGVSVSGGEGRTFGIILSVLIFNIISDIFNLLGMSRYLYQLVIGVVLLIGLGLRRKMNK